MQELIQHSISLIKQAEKLSLVLSSDGFIVGFSGGKDSQVLLQLMKMADVKFKAVYNVTTNDDSDNIRFIKSYYPEVVFDRSSISFLTLVSKHGLPTQRSRFCCRVFKETKGLGHVVVTGVRRDESVKRSSYSEVSKFGDISGSYDLSLMEDRGFQCVDGSDKFFVRPILNWSSSDIWWFIRRYSLPINPCYYKYRRVGCLFCPFAPKSQIIKVVIEKPKLFNALLNAIQLYIDSRDENYPFVSAFDYFSWWLSGLNVHDYMLSKKQLKLL